MLSLALAVALHRSAPYLFQIQRKINGHLDPRDRNIVVFKRLTALLRRNVHAVLPSPIQSILKCELSRKGMVS